MDAPLAPSPVMIFRSGLAAVLAAGIFGVSGCADSPTAPPSRSELVERYDLQLLPEMVFPRDNPPNPDRIELGRLIFFDPIQSAGKDVACSTCHLPRFGFADGRDLPVGPSGVGLGPERVLTDPDMVPEGRHSPTVINVGFNRFGAEWTADGFMFWDGRKRRLENLVTLPQTEFSEMRGEGYSPEETTDTVLARFRAIPEYEELFRKAFPGNAAAVDRGERESAVDSLSWARALAQFVRSITSTDSRYDRFVAGDESALTDAEKRGLVLFHEKADCAACHSGPMFSDFKFHVVGAKQLGPGFQGTPHEDLGRWNVTRLDQDRYKFRTPSLRNVAETAPYMHSGGYATLEDVLAFKDRGGGDHPFVPRDRIELEPLGLTGSEMQDIIAFLKALSDPPEVEVPERVPSGLTVPR
ncbi:MAG: cytochrome-c peroxidase [Gemmatimonadota bacterium]